MSWPRKALFMNNFRSCLSQIYFSKESSNASFFTWIWIFLLRCPSATTWPALLPLFIIFDIVPGWGSCYKKLLFRLLKKIFSDCSQCSTLLDWYSISASSVNYAKRSLFGLNKRKLVSKSPWPSTAFGHSYVLCTVSIATISTFCKYWSEKQRVVPFVFYRVTEACRFVLLRFFLHIRMIISKTQDKAFLQYVETSTRNTKMDIEHFKNTRRRPTDCITFLYFVIAVMLNKNENLH